MHLPVEKVLPQVAAALAENRPVVLQAPPGSGKTTLVAPSLLDAPWLANKKILLLEPRRMAARMAARYMAGQLGEAVGERVGFQVRLERMIGRNTRIEVLTEGLLTQRMMHDPELADVGLIIFDEFHERSLSGDTGFALANDIRMSLREDLRVVVMSATLETESIAAYLGQETAVITSEARQHPVSTVLLSRASTLPCWESAAQAVERALERETGSLLVFLPGEGEIRRTEELLRKNLRGRADVLVCPLYAQLDRRLQDEAVEPEPNGLRKVVLATSIAESSITIQGIGVVIDTGWMRVPRFSPATGMGRLETLRITRDRADQRRGRAGRLAAGVCYRLWDEATDISLSASARPEILDADLAPLVLQCAAWGDSRITGLNWLTPPNAASWQQAVELLRELGALDSDGRITTRGRAMSRFPVHPRLANMIVEADDFGWGGRACELAAELAGDRELATRWKTQLRQPRAAEVAPDGLLLAFGYPDRIARKRTAGGYQMAGGGGAKFTEPKGSEWIVIGELQDTGLADSIIRMAEPFEERWLEDYFPHMFNERAITAWDKQKECVVAAERMCFGEIVLKERRIENGDLTAAQAEGIRSKGIAQLDWSRSARQLQERVCFLARVLSDQHWPDVSDGGLEETAERWLEMFAGGMTRWEQLRKIDLAAVINALLTREQQRELERLAPTHFKVPSGSNCVIHYDAADPYVAVRIQEVFGLMKTPRIADGRTALVLHLLSPAQRPVQITRDLESFWNTGYEMVRKDLRGRYPKHYWPEDPRQAEPTRRVRPK